MKYDSQLDLDANLSGLIAESPAVQSQDINFYLKSLLSPGLGGLGTKNRPFKFRTPKNHLPCTQRMPDSDTPGSLANFVVDDFSIFSDESQDAHYESSDHIDLEENKL